jgi:hypothetical protein
VNELEVGEMMSIVIWPVGVQSRFEGVKAIAHRPVAQGVEMALEPQPVEGDDDLFELFGIDEIDAAITRRDSGTIEVGVEQ